MTPADRAREIARCRYEIAEAAKSGCMGSIIGWLDWHAEIIEIEEAAQASGEGK